MCSSGSNGDAGSCVEAGQHSLSSQVSYVQCVLHSLVKEGVNDESAPLTANSCVRRPACMSALSCPLRHCSTKAHHAHNVSLTFLPPERISSPPVTAKWKQQRKRIGVIERSLFAIQGAC